jgi:hypothetical protein
MATFANKIAELIEVRRRAPIVELYQERSYFRYGLNTGYSLASHHVTRSAARGRQ